MNLLAVATKQWLRSVLSSCLLQLMVHEQSSHAYLCTTAGTR
jgi:hypothetical protein